MRSALESKSFAIEVMAELVAESAEKCAERRDLFSHRCSRPDANHLFPGRVVSEEFRSPAALSNAKRSSRQGAYVRRMNPIKPGRLREEIGARSLHFRPAARLHGEFDGLRERSQSVVLWQFEGGEAVAFHVLGQEFFPARRPVRDHT
jgi:hypothetical protein